MGRSFCYLTSYGQWRDTELGGLLDDLNSVVAKLAREVEGNAHWTVVECF